MTASCGHDISAEWFDQPESQIAIRSYTRECDHAVDYMVVCPECRAHYAASDSILTTEAEKQAWMEEGQVPVKGFREQFIECSQAELNSKSEFVPFENHPDMLPAFPNRQMLEAIKSQEFKGLDLLCCGRFGGRCSSANPDCRKLRGLNADGSRRKSYV